MDVTVVRTFLVHSEKCREVRVRRAADADNYATTTFVQYANNLTPETTKLVLLATARHHEGT